MKTYKFNTKQKGGINFKKSSIIKKISVYDLNKEYTFHQETIKKKKKLIFFQIKTFINNKLGRSKILKIILPRVRNKTRKKNTYPYQKITNFKTDNLIKTNIITKLKKNIKGCYKYI